MKVKDVILSAAEVLGAKDRIAEYYRAEGGTTAGKREAEELLDCFNRVENQVALDYLPLYCEDEAVSTTGKIAYTDLSRTPVKIVRVTDEYGNALPFKIFPQYMKTREGSVRILYTYTPEKKTAEDDCEYAVSVSTRLLTYGVASEYCLICGLYEEAAVWEKKYKDALAAACRDKGTKVLRSRRWA